MKIKLKSKKLKKVKNIKVTEEKRPAHRPTKYKPEYCQKMIDYFNKAPYTIKTIKAFGKVINKVMPTDLPLLVGFASELKVDRDTLKEWAKVHEEFSAAYKKAKDLQEKILITNGLNGGYNPAFAIFTAKNVMKWTDRVDHKVQSEEIITINNERYGQVLNNEYEIYTNQGSGS